MAPEIFAQYWIEDVDYFGGFTHRCDFWNLGMIYVYLLCGNNPILENVR